MERRRDSGRTVLKTGEYQRPNGTYMFRYKGDDGKMHAVYAKTLRLLREKEREFEKRKATGKSVSLSGKRLNDVYDEWKRTKSEMIRSSTYSNYLYIYDLYAKHAIGRKKLTEIRKDDVVRFYSRLRTEKGCSVSTVDNLHTVVHQVFGFAVEQRYLEYNPSDRCMVDLKKIARNNRIQDVEEDDGGDDDGVALTLEQEVLLLDFLKRSKTYNHWYPLMGGMLLFGPRLGEMAGLQWSDVNFQKNTIRINKTCVYLRDPKTKKMKFEMHPPKTSAGLRWVVMSKPLREIFEKEWEIRRERGAFKASVDGYDDFVFASRFEGPIHQNTINKAIRRIVRDCNAEQLGKDEKKPVLLPDFSSHSFRRTFATRMVEIGLNVKALQNILGHADAGVTLNIYTKVQRELKERQTELIDEKYASMFATEVRRSEA